MDMGLRMGRAGGDDHDGGEAVFSPLLRQLLAGGYGMDWGGRSGIACQTGKLDLALADIKNRPRRPVLLC